MRSDRRGQPLSSRALGFGFEQLVRRGLRGVWVRGELPAPPLVWASNHHSWWDGFIPAALLRAHDLPASMIVDEQNLADYRFLAEYGVIGADRPRAALAALRAGRVLIVLPEGALRAPGPLGALAPGAAWLARTAPAPLVPVAVRVVLRGHQHPEAYVDIGDPAAGDELAGALGDLLAGLDTALAAGDPRAPLDGFRLELAGRASWDERIARWAGAR